MVTDLVSIRKNIHALVNIQAIRFSDCYVADFFEVERLMNIYPNIAKIFYLYMEEHYMFGLKRQRSFIFNTPQERYINLFIERPDVIAEIPQHYIASYLGIEPETLSRIKKRMLK
jgi:CRP/FNR family transcriptional regulator, anaerobic regulatory protein